MPRGASREAGWFWGCRLWGKVRRHVSTTPLSKIRSWPLFCCFALPQILRPPTRPPTRPLGLEEK